MLSFSARAVERALLGVGRDLSDGVFAALFANLAVVLDGRVRLGALEDLALVRVDQALPLVLIARDLRQVLLHYRQQLLQCLKRWNNNEVEEPNLRLRDVQRVAVVQWADIEFELAFLVALVEELFKEHLGPLEADVPRLRRR